MPKRDIFETCSTDTIQFPCAIYATYFFQTSCVSDGTTNVNKSTVDGQKRTEDNYGTASYKTDNYESYASYSRKGTTNLVSTTYNGSSTYYSSNSAASSSYTITTFNPSQTETVTVPSFSESTGMGGPFSGSSVNTGYVCSEFSLTADLKSVFDPAIIFESQLPITRTSNVCTTVSFTEDSDFNVNQTTSSKVPALLTLSTDGTIFETQETTTRSYETYTIEVPWTTTLETETTETAFTDTTVSTSTDIQFTSTRWSNGTTYTYTTKRTVNDTTNITDFISTQTNTTTTRAEGGTTGSTSAETATVDTILKLSKAGSVETTASGEVDTYVYTKAPPTSTQQDLCFGNTRFIPECTTLSSNDVRAIAVAGNASQSPYYTEVDIGGIFNSNTGSRFNIGETSYYKFSPFEFIATYKTNAPPFGGGEVELQPLDDIIELSSGINESIILFNDIYSPKLLASLSPLQSTSYLDNPLNYATTSSFDTGYVYCGLRSSPNDINNFYTFEEDLYFTEYNNSKGKKEVFTYAIERASGDYSFAPEDAEPQKMHGTFETTAKSIQVLPIKFSATFTKANGQTETKTHQFGWTTHHITTPVTTIATFSRKGDGYFITPKDSTVTGESCSATTSALTTEKRNCVGIRHMKRVPIGYECGGLDDDNIDYATFLYDGKKKGIGYLGFGENAKTDIDTAGVYAFLTTSMEGEVFETSQMLNIDETNINSAAYKVEYSASIFPTKKRFCIPFGEQAGSTSWKSADVSANYISGSCITSGEEQIKFNTSTIIEATYTAEKEVEEDVITESKFATYTVGLHTPFNGQNIILKGADGEEISYSANTNEFDQKKLRMKKIIPEVPMSYTVPLGKYNVIVRDSTGGSNETGTFLASGLEEFLEPSPNDNNRLVKRNDLYHYYSETRLSRASQWFGGLDDGLIIPAGNQWRTREERNAFPVWYLDDEIYHYTAYPSPYDYRYGWTTGDDLKCGDVST